MRRQEPSRSSWDNYPFDGTHDMVPVFTEYSEESHGEEGAEDVGATLHHGRDEFGQGGHAHQDDGHEGQNHVDALPQQDLGVHGICLQGLLLLLVQLQLGDACLARFQGFLRARGESKAQMSLESQALCKHMPGCASSSSSEHLLPR